MAGQEFTQTFKVTGTGTGPTPPTYCQLQDDAGNGTYIVKNISYYATVNFMLSTFEMQFVSSADDAGTGLFPIYVNTPDPATDANVVIEIADQFILKQNYIGASGTLSAAGTIYFTITYIYIPSTSIWGSNFLCEPLQVDSGSQGSLEGPTSGNAYVIKSIYIANLNNAAANVQIQLSTTTQLQNVILAVEDPISASNTVTFIKPVYLQVGQTLIINNNVGSSVGVEALISYTQDPSEPVA